MADQFLQGGAHAARGDVEPTRVHLPYAVVLDGVFVSDGQGVVAGLALALPDEEGSRLVASLQQLLLRIRALDFPKEPAITISNKQQNNKQSTYVRTKHQSKKKKKRFLSQLAILSYARI